MFEQIYEHHKKKHDNMLGNILKNIGDCGDNHNPGKPHKHLKFDLKNQELKLTEC